MKGIPCWGERLAKLQKTFVESFKKSSPDFQSQHGYAIDEPNQANLNICAHAVSPAIHAVPQSVTALTTSLVPFPCSICICFIGVYGGVLTKVSLQ